MRRTIPFHLFLFVAYPVLFLFAKNIGEARPVDAVRCILVLVLMNAVLYAVARLILRNAVKAAVLVSFLAIMFFAYGPLFDVAYTISATAGLTFAQNRIIFPFWILVSTIGLVVILRSRGDMRGASSLLNVAGVVLVSIQLLQIGAGYARMARHQGSRDWSAVVAGLDQPCEWKGAGPKPDIYYIVLDAFARSDALKRYYGYSDADFISHLKRKGFYVANASRANYIETYPSLASTLNMDYLHTLSKSAGAKSVNMRLLGQMIKDSRTCRLVKSAGYKFVFFPSGYQATDRNPNADIIFRRGYINLGEFEDALMNISALRAFDLAGPVHRERIIYTFDRLESIPDIKEPTFTFAHIVCPHPPYVFNAGGVTPSQPFLLRRSGPMEDYVRLYLGQVQYVSNRALKVIDTIIAKSDVPPIIIIQSDHGPTFKGDLTVAADANLAPMKSKDDLYRVDMKTAVLNAYYFPGPSRDALYSSISPVNSFRALFSQYFGSDLPRLPDRSYFTGSTPTEHVYTFHQIPLKYLKGNSH